MLITRKISFFIRAELTRFPIENYELMVTGKEANVAPAGIVLEVVAPVKRNDLPSKRISSCFAGEWDY